MATFTSNAKLYSSADGVTISVEGLSDFSRALKQAGEQFPKELQKANVRVTRRIVVKAREIARAKPGRTGGRSVQAKAVASLRSGYGLTSAYIEGGGPSAPWFYGAEFGSKRYGQFDSWRGNQHTSWEGGPGYFLHPAIREEGPESIREYMETLDDILGKAFPELS